MASCQIWWKSMWENVLISCGICVDKLVESAHCEQTSHNFVWESRGFMHRSTQFVQNIPAICGKELLGRISSNPQISTIST